MKSLVTWYYTSSIWKNS